MEKMDIKEIKKIYKENKGEIKNDDVNGFVVLKDINKIYPNHVQAVYDFSLSIKENEFIVLVGPSGCGKSTTLRMIAGLEEISSGYLYINKIIANHLESKDRNIAMVFQNYALYPNMTVYDNIAFGLKIKKVPQEEIKNRVFNAAKILDLGSYLDRKPRELSGGQMQRVALGRAIVRDAKVFLMDEPLSNLDAKLRVQMRSEIVKIHKQIKTTTIYVTHDQTEAMTMADRIVVMNHGFIQQVGRPKEIYNNPKNIFVATFIGTPPMNIFNANLSNKNIYLDSDNIEIDSSFLESYKKFLINKKEYFNKLKEISKIKEIEEINELILDKNNIDEVKTKLNIIKENYPLINKQIESLIKLIDDNNQTKKYKKFINKFKEELKEINYFLIGEIRKVKSSNYTSFNSVSTSSKQKKEDKKSFIEEYNEAIKIIDKNLALYSSEEDSYNLYFGIRPEDIHLYEDNIKNKSVVKEVEITFFELMGSEYLVHFTLFNTNLIMKVSNSKDINIGDKIKIFFDLDKIKIFDKESGENILWEK